jgi:hypothetical protein
MTTTGASGAVGTDPMINHRSDARQKRETQVSPDGRRHHALDAFQTSGSSPPLNLAVDPSGRGGAAADTVGWGRPWSC